MAGLERPGSGDTPSVPETVNDDSEDDGVKVAGEDAQFALTMFDLSPVSSPPMRRWRDR